MYEYKAKVLRAIDGDTLEVEIDLGFSVTIKERVRLLDVNTPEMHGVLKESEEYQRGLAALIYVQAWLGSCYNSIIMHTEKSKFAQDKYGRYLAKIIANDGAIKGQSLNEALKTSGHSA